MANNNHEVITIAEAMELLRLSRSTVIRMVAWGDLRGFRAGKQWRVYRESVEQMRQSPAVPEELPFSVPPCEETA